MIEEAKDLGEYRDISEMHKAAMALFIESLKTKKYGRKKSPAKEPTTQSSEGTPKNR